MSENSALRPILSVLSVIKTKPIFVHNFYLNS